MIVDEINNIFTNYLTDLASFNSDKSRPRIRSNYSTVLSLEQTIPNEINNFINPNEYLCKGSAGEGMFAEIPWVAIFDKDITNSARTGYYIVYLFDSKMQGLYLCLGFGWTQYDQFYQNLELNKSREHIKDHKLKTQNLLRSTQGFSKEPINLNATGTLGKGYELGTIINKYYAKNSFPLNNEIMVDMQYMIGVYRELKGILGADVFKLDNDPILNANISTVSQDSLPTTSSEIPDETNRQANERKKASITGDKGEAIFIENAYNYWGWENLIDKTDQQNLGYDFLCEKPELYIEVKGCLDDPCAIRLTNKEWEVAQQKRDKYILVIVFQIDDKYETADMVKIEDPYDKFKEDDIEERVVQVKSLHISRNAIRSVI